MGTDSSPGLFTVNREPQGDPMRISSADGTHVVCLTEAEASSLVEACALMVLAVQADPRVSLPPLMGQVLGELFEGLRQPVALDA